MGIKKGKGNLGIPDYIDYKREMAAKGELHALDVASGGLFGKKRRSKKSSGKKSTPKQKLLPIWEDRNRSNIGSKLNG